MGYKRTENGDGLIEIKCESISLIPKKALPTKTKQYCRRASDRAIKDMIRGMDDRERMIVAHELLKIYGKEDS